MYPSTPYWPWQGVPIVKSPSITTLHMSDEECEAAREREEARKGKRFGFARALDEDDDE